MIEAVLPFVIIGLLVVVLFPFLIAVVGAIVEFITSLLTAVCSLAFLFVIGFITTHVLQFFFGDVPLEQA